MRFSQAPALGGPSGPETSEGPGEAGWSAQSVPQFLGRYAFISPGSQRGGPQGAPLSWARSCLAVPSVQEPWPVRVTQGGHTAESSQHGRCGRPAATGGPRVCSCLWPRAVKVAPGRKDEREGRSSVRGQKKCVFSSATFPRWVG